MVLLNGESSMSDAPSVERELRDLNVEIGSKETVGDRAFFRRLLHEAFVFLRASGDVDDKKWFLEKLKKSEERDTRVESIQIYENRAVVTAVVAMTVGEEQAEFHNIRIFLRTPAGWELFAWANERVPKP